MDHQVQPLRIELPIFGSYLQKPLLVPTRFLKIKYTREPGMLRSKIPASWTISVSHNASEDHIDIHRKF